jgi:hypothetical protein
MMRFLQRAGIGWRSTAPWVAAVLVLGGCARAESTPTGAGVALTIAVADAGNPTVALDAARGLAYVAWVDGSEGEYAVRIAPVAISGGDRGEAVRVNAMPGDASLHEAAPPQVAVGPGGEVYVAWESSYPVQGRRFPASDLRFARSLDGGRTFGPTRTINSDADGLPSSHTFHNLAVAPDGTIYVSWIDGRARDRARAEQASRAHAGVGDAHGQGGHAAHGGGGEAELPGSELWLAVSRDGGETFQEIAVIDRDVCPCCRTGLATGRDGSVYVVWRQIAAGEVRDIAIAHSNDGGLSFSDPVPVHRDGWIFPGCPHAGPTIAVAGDGSVHVAWYTGKQGRQGTYYAASADGGRTFATPIPLLVGEWVPPSLARVAVDGDQVWVAWDDRREERGLRRVHLARVERGQLSEALRLNGSTPDLALAGSRQALVWHDGDAVQLQLMRH